MSELVVGVVSSARPWRSALQRHVRDHAAGVALRVVRDSRVALEEHVDVLVVDDETSFLDAAFLGALRERRVTVAGVYDPTEADAHGEAVLRRLGVDVVVPATLAPEDLLAHLAEVRPARGPDDAFDELVAGLDLAGAEAPAEAPPAELVAVGGPPGSGATEVAVALAAALSARARTVLVDVDEVRPGVARRLQLGVHPHVLTALDLVRGVALGDAAAPAEASGGEYPLARILARPAPGGPAASLPFDVVAGLADPRDWAVLRGDDVLALFDELLGPWRYAVANLGPSLEDLSRWVDRYGARRRGAWPRCAAARGRRPRSAGGEQKPRGSSWGAGRRHVVAAGVEALAVAV